MHQKSPQALLILFAGTVLLGLTLWNSPYLGQSSKPWTLQIEGNLREAQKDAVRQLLTRINLDDASLADLKTQLESLTWVYQVSARQAWPKHVSIHVQEQQAVALWNDENFLNADGDLFESGYLTETNLPRLYGPRGKERLVMSHYQQFNRALLSTGSSMASLTMERRGGWKFTLNDDVEVLLGKEDIMERMTRYLQIVADGELATHMSDIKTIDTRYSNGVAVSWKDDSSSLASIDNF